MNCEHTNSTNSPLLQSPGSVVFHEAAKELQVLEEKMKNAEKEANADSIIFSSPG